MIYAETSRLHLRALEKEDLPRLAELIGDWDVTKWLTMAPYPYTMKDAQEFYDKMLVGYQNGVPEYFVMAQKTDDLLMGAVGLHPSRVPNPKPGEIEIGYWLGKMFWKQGFTSEAAKATIDIAFRRAEVKVIAATTDPINEVSKNLLRKVGLKTVGIFPREKIGFRGPSEFIRWELKREDYIKMTGPS